MDNAFKYIIHGGLETESDYGYTGRDGTCHSDAAEEVVTISGYYDVPELNTAALMAAVAQQPVSVAIQADQFSFRFYQSGVLTGECGTDLDHGVLAAGYGTENGTDYWLVKNSWGPGWGEEGYIKIERGSSNKCGIECAASYPTGARDL